LAPRNKLEVAENGDDSILGQVCEWVLLQCENRHFHSDFQRAPIRRTGCIDYRRLLQYRCGPDTVNSHVLAALPALPATRGCIVLIGSLGWHCCVTRFALNGLSEPLPRIGFGISSTHVMSGFVRTVQHATPDQTKQPRQIVSAAYRRKRCYILS